VRTDARKAMKMAITHTIVPLHLSGNTTDEQNRGIQELLGESVLEAYRTAIEQLDEGRARVVLEMEKKIRPEIVTQIIETIHRYTVSDKYKEEQVASDRVYPPAYKVRAVEVQVSELRKTFPKLGACMEKISRRDLPEGAEDWFAIPRWEALASTYNEAVELVMGVLSKRRKFQNRISDKMGPTYLRQSERSKLASKILADQQTGNDILVVALQAGIRHRGCSARRARARLEGNEFALGVFEVACLLLTHPERVSSDEALMIDCGGDEYSVRGDYTFDRVPLFDFDISGIEFSIFYEDRSRNLWGTPSGFLYKMV
jgi:hypothetical protein